MKLINSSVDIIEQKSGIDGIYKMIECAGRTCYRSEDKITEDSAKEFVDRMIKSKHGAMLEHGTVYLKFYNTQTWVSEMTLEDSTYTGLFYTKNKYSKCNQVENYMYVTTNLRVLVENNRLDDLRWICEPTEHHEKRITARFTCDRACTHEIVRHRTLSFAQESQRYVGYDKERFGCEVTFIKPHWYDEEFPACLTWIEGLKEAEKKYMELREAGLKPQDARGVLPNATKTEIVVTGFESDWNHFFSLRSPKYGAQGPHPDIAKLADELYEKLNSVNE